MLIKMRTVKTCTPNSVQNGGSAYSGKSNIGISYVRVVRCRGRVDVISCLTQEVRPTNEDGK